jgi:YbgC/YbaW family acyl-CoA thioester hydrolase
MLHRESFRCFSRMRVRWAEVDAQKIVFNAHYMMYADTAISEYWRALAVPYESGFAKLGGELYVKKATVEYHASARYGDVLDVGVRCAAIGNSSMRYEIGIFSGSALLSSVELVYVFADPATQKSQPVPAALRLLIDDFEAGRAFTELRSGDWNQLGREALRLRTDVFVREQQIDVALEVDGRDEAARHVVVYNRLEQAVATGRLITESPGVGRIGRLAVDRDLRGSRLGRQVLDALVAASQARGDREVQLHAQRSAEGFYLRAGFSVQGEPYEEAGIEHITMVRSF